jgi:hypothetical protein
MPYKDFASVQPPGILLLMTPVALVAKVTTTVKAMALARLLTALASAACVPLAGNLVRHRGALATLVTCGVLAVYPGDIASAHTLMLEPWMNLCCLLAANAAFRHGALTSPRRLAIAGLAFGFAGTIKFWAIAPAAAVFALCLLAKPGSLLLRRLRAYVPGLAVGFLLPVLPFLLSAPGAFLQGTISDQATRDGAAVPLAERLAYLTGTIDILNGQGQISPLAGPRSIYVSGPWNVDLSAGIGWLPLVAAALIVAVIAAGYAARLRAAQPLDRPSHLEWAALATAVLAVAMVLGYSAFFYHYPDFPAPWLALSAGGAAAGLGSLVSRNERTRRAAGLTRLRTRLLFAVAAVVFCVGAFQSWEVHGMAQPVAENRAHLIPKGACVVTDEVSLAIAADRFTQNPPGCPVILDALASTLVLGNGISVQGGADKLPRVVAQWKAWLAEADYVWLSPYNGSFRRIPWTPALLAWFSEHFRPVGDYTNGTGQIYKRVR